MPETVQVCRKCEIVLTDANWPKARRAVNSRICRSCENAYQAERKKRPGIREQEHARVLAWRRANPERVAATHWRFKAKVIRHYSPEGCCVLCGFQDIRALTIDHIEGGGNRHRKAIGASGTQFYRWLVKEGFPEGFRVLCMNCQFISRVQHTEACHAT